MRHHLNAHGVQYVYIYSGVYIGVSVTRQWGAITGINKIRTAPTPLLTARVSPCLLGFPLLDMFLNRILHLLVLGSVRSLRGRAHFSPSAVLVRGFPEL